MKNICNILIYSCLAILFNGCFNDDGSFGQVVTFDIPKEEPRMVCNAKFLDTDTVLNVFLSLSKGVNDDPYTDKMDKASVQFFKNNVLVTDFPKKLPFGGTSFNATNYFSYNQKGLTEGDYKLSITYPPYKALEAIMKMPEKVNIKSAKYTDDGFVQTNGDKLNELVVEFVDPASQNYYDFEILYEYQTDKGLIIYSQPYQVTTSTTGSGLFSDIDRTTIFNDAIFNGKTHKLRIGVGSSSGAYDPVTGKFLSSDVRAIVIKFYSLSKDSYLYEKSLQEYENSQYNPFGAEPSQINTNFKNGFGMFEVRRASTFRLEL